MTLIAYDGIALVRILLHFFYGDADMKAFVAVPEADLNVVSLVRSQAKLARNCSHFYSRVPS